MTVLGTGAVSTQIQLLQHPVGWPEMKDFGTYRVELPELGENEVRVANEFISVDPYMRSRMSGVKTYIDPFEIGQTMTGGAVGRVIETRSAAHKVGDLVLHDLGWRDVAQGPGDVFRRVPELPDLPSSLYLGILGMPGHTAYTGLLRIAELRQGDTVFVSGAAGAVGTAVAQIARLKGAGRIIGSAGSAAKVQLLTERYGYDAAFNYKDSPVLGQLRDYAPQGIDLYYDNVGGEHLEAALGLLNNFGRVAVCGSISNYNSVENPSGPNNLHRLITHRLQLKGFVVYDHEDLYDQFVGEMSAWIKQGDVVFDETVIDGIENAPGAFLSLMQGDNIGKMVVRCL